ncbi:hypothetical protein [Mucilaginibacter ginsenosidivorans]|uniref:Uncharacterized protein n=1 Tax=Mucilaginibacter ginsenosidivorans TaxID=398053 RepID=A0A5B8V267_9SPHI|nr:hypothetical protein [Mucilaginibacter ginsenosidivorans]QEC65165.1 hypothetical protein FRZ54_22195 [Mucilaginibacter ginsenosidivorans]
MLENEPTFEIFREDGVLISVKAIIPTWTKQADDGSIEILLPHLGGATIFVESEDDVDKTIDDMFKAFCIMVEKHGNGLEHELEAIGWKSFKKHKVNQSLLNMLPERPVYDFMINTGSTRVLQTAI